VLLVWGSLLVFGEGPALLVAVGVGPVFVLTVCLIVAVGRRLVAPRTGPGVFAARTMLGLAAIIWSYVYFAAMITRYVIRMARRPEQRWLGGTIPIIFHAIVAAFQWTFGTYHAPPL